MAPIEVPITQSGSIPASCLVDASLIRTLRSATLHDQHHLPRELLPAYRLEI
jgi:hypothetical protein